MKAPKIRRKLLAGILCASMLFQNVPMNANADEGDETIQETESIEVQVDEGAEESKIEESKIEESETEEVNIQEMQSVKPEDTGEEDTYSSEVETVETEALETEFYSGIDNLEDASDSGTEPTTEETIDMTVAFPDEVFRGKLLALLGVGENGSVTEEMLQGIDTIDFSRKSFDEPAITNIKGIALLTGLTTVDLSYHEISDVRNDIEWSRLSELKSINLNGNEITIAPNFYQNSKLEEVQVKENLLDAAQLRYLQGNGVPNQNVKLADDTLFSQRKDGFHINVEETYYEAKMGVPITVMVGGYKSQLPYTIKFKIDNDDQDIAFLHKTTDQKKYENIYWKNTNLSEGEHGIVITLEQGGETLGEISKSFRVVQQDCYSKEDSYRFSTNSGADVIDLYYTFDKINTIDHITLTDENGKEYLYPNVAFRTSDETKDYRYKDIEGNAGLYVDSEYMNHTSFSMKDSISVLPRGTYDLNVFLKDKETSYCLENLIRIAGGSVVDNWSCDISSDVLYWNDNDRNTAELTVINTDKAAVFEIEDIRGDAVNIELTSAEPNKAVITASEGKEEGTCESVVVIKITVGNSIQRKEIKVYRRTYASRLEIDPTDITINGLNRSSDINVKVDPEEALQIREAFEITSSNTNVFVIEKQVETDTGIRISIKSVGSGDAELTVKVKDSDVPSVTCNITVIESSFSDLEKETLLKNVGTIYCITNVHGTRLGDLTLPNGWEWVNPDTIVTLSNDAPSEVQRYSARYTQESYVPFTMPVPVAVTQITGVKVTGPIELTASHEGDYSVKLTYRGYYVESNKAFVDAVDKAVLLEWSADNIFTINNRNNKSIKVQATNVNEVTAGVITASATVGEEVFSEGYDVIVLPEHITQIKIMPTTDKIQYAVNYKYNEEENAVYVDEAGVSNQSYRIKFALRASMEDKDVEIKKGAFTWTINNPDLGEIKEAADGSVQLYIRGSGTIILRATANDVGEKYAEIAVEVRDYSPILETNIITLNKYALDGTQLPVYPIEGNELVSIRVNNDNFNITRVDGKYVMSIVDKDIYTKNATVDAQLTVRTQMGNPVTWDVKLLIDTTKPKVKFTQKTAPNIFYADTTAEYIVSSNCDILSITESGDRTAGFSVVSYDKETGLLTVNAKGLNKSTVSEFKNKNSEYCNLPLLIKYDEYGTQSETLKIASKTQRLSYKVQELSVISTGQQMDTYLTDTKTKKEAPLSESSRVTSLTPFLTAERNGEHIRLEYSGQKGIGYKILVSDDNWTEDLRLSGKISVVKDLSTLLDTKKINLNMAHNIQRNGYVSVKVSAKNNSNILITDVRCDAANAKAQELVDNGCLKIRHDVTKSTLDFGLDTTKMSGVRAGNYNFKVYAIAQGEIELKPATLSISLVDASKSPSVKLSGKGQINLVDRKNTSILYTLKLNNMTSSVKSVKVTGGYAGLFDAKLDKDGKIEVKAMEAVSLNTINYVVNLELGFQNNTTVSASVKIKPFNKTPKIEAGRKTGTIYKASNNEVKWRVYNRGSFGEISDIVLTDSEVNQNFTITKADNNQITLKLTDAAKRTIKEGKYTIVYQVKFKDMASNAKPVTMKLSITVK